LLDSLLQEVYNNRKMLRIAVFTLAISSVLARCPDRITDPKVCAILYDEDRCEGWALSIHQGTNIPVEKERSGILGSIIGTASKIVDKVSGPFVDLAKGDDAESVLIRRGCTFTGYDRPAGHIFGQGDKISITADKSKDTYIQFDTDKYDDLDEEIEAMDCFCPEDSISTRSNIPSGCPKEITEPGVCAILYDEEDCGGWAFKVKEGQNIKVGRGTLASIGDKVAGPLVDLAKGDDAESVLVRKGCTFTGHDRSKGHILGSGDSIQITAHPNQDTYASFDTPQYEDLDEEIEAVDCSCQ